MTTSLDPSTLANLLDDMMAWLKSHPGADLQDFADDRNCSIDDISDSWNTYFDADFSRDYKIDTDNDGGYHPQPPPHGDPQALKSYIVNEVNTYQQYTTINNIEDNSFNQQIIAGGDVTQDIDIDNSDNIADNGGVLIQDSDVDGSNIVTGNENVVDSEDVLTGDVTTTAGDGGQAASNINFGDGDITNTQQTANIDVDNTGDNTSGDTGSANGIGGKGGDAGADSDATGGVGGEGGDGDPFLGLGGGGGDGGGAGSVAGASADGGDGTGGTSGDSGNAGNDTDIEVNF